MSNFVGSSHYDDADIERQIDEVYRRSRQQALQASSAAAVGGPQAAAFSALARSRPDYAHLGMLNATDAVAAAASPYYARQSAPGPVQHPPTPGSASSPYARSISSNPYLLNSAADQAGSLSQLYAHQQHQKQQAIQKAVAVNYAAVYGTHPPPPPPPPSSLKAISPTATSAASLDDRFLYSLPPLQSKSSTSPTASVSAAASPVSSQAAHQAAHEIAIMQEAFNRERKNSMKRHSSYSVSTPTPASTVPPAAASSANTACPSASSAFSPHTPSSSSINSMANNSNSSLSPNHNDSGGTPAFTSRALRLPPPIKTNGSRKKDYSTFAKDLDGKLIVEDRGSSWYMGSVPLGVDDDKYWLSELQVYLRANFAEAFAATEDDIAAPMHGRNKPIALGQVGIRCMHCKSDNPAERGQQATSYPSLISGIYNSVQQMLRLHLDCCLIMPSDVRQKIEQLKLSCSSRGGRKQYWIDSARRLGLIDTPHGIHFHRDPMGPLPPLTGPSVNSRENRKKKIMPPKLKKPKPPKLVEEEESEKEKPLPPPVDSRPLVFPEDKHLISDYLYLTLEQMAPCSLTEADRVGCYKTRKVGFPGLACKHCVGQAGCGRYFPASEASLSQTTTSQTIMNHVRNCRRCPIEIRENLEIMKRSRMGPDGKRSEKPKHGGRKVFFHRLWCRIQNVPFEEGKGETKESKRRKNQKGSGKRKTQQSLEHGEDVDETDDEDREDIDEDDDTGSDSHNESGIDDESSDGSDDSQEAKPKAKRKTVSAAPQKKKGPSPWVEGCVRLCKTDDPHWLSELEVYARSDLVEVFSLGKNDELEGYPGRKEPVEGQVGIRCVFCKSLDASDRPNGCVTFPDTLSAIHTKVVDMIRLHFPSCPSMPKGARETFKSLRGFGTKVASDDSQQYWVDAARDIGLANIPAAGPSAVGAWGITFRRDPLHPSPADELDLEATNNDHAGTFGKNALVRPDDRGLCTDQVILLLRQVRPCRFKNSDRRAGPGSRGRDRVMGFPGLCCMHCNGRNTLGRYFPVSAKNLTDSTANSLQVHVASCTRCPEPIKASLAYMGHRSILQKAELSGSWKKAFFQKVWSRLHVEREWTSVDDDDGDAATIDYSDIDEGIDEPQGEDEAVAPEEEGVREEAVEEPASDEEKEELGDQMNALIKAAAIWLTEQDAATESNKAATRGTRGRGVTVKRPSPPTPSRGGGRATTGSSTKRRRVHF